MNSTVFSIYSSNLSTISSNVFARSYINHAFWAYIKPCLASLKKSSSWSRIVKGQKLSNTKKISYSSGTKIQASNSTRFLMSCRSCLRNDSITTRRYFGPYSRHFGGESTRLSLQSSSSLRSLNCLRSSKRKLCCTTLISHCCILQNQ